jgi:hypothetical protein
MKNSKTNIPKAPLTVFRIVLCFMAFYFFSMGLMLVLFPQILTRLAGEQHGIILGMLRGAGGSIIPYSLMYMLIALKPFESRWIAYIIAFANALAIVLDFTSVFLKEYMIIFAMIDVPFEFTSLVALVVFYSVPSVRQLPRNLNA